MGSIRDFKQRQRIVQVLYDAQTPFERRYQLYETLDRDDITTEEHESIEGMGEFIRIKSGVAQRYKLIAMSDEAELYGREVDDVEEADVLVGPMDNLDAGDKLLQVVLDELFGDQKEWSDTHCQSCGWWL